MNLPSLLLNRQRPRWATRKLILVTPLLRRLLADILEEFPYKMGSLVWKRKRPATYIINRCK